MAFNCFFCNSSDLKDVKMQYDNIPSQYFCPICGDVYLENKTAGDISGENFTEEQKRIISIFIRNEYEKRNRRPFTKTLTLQDLHQFVNQYSPLDPLSKMDNALLNIEKASGFVGAQINIHYGHDYP